MTNKTSTVGEVSFYFSLLDKIPKKEKTIAWFLEVSQLSKKDWELLSSSQEKMHDLHLQFWKYMANQNIIRIKRKTLEYIKKKNSSMEGLSRYATGQDLEKIKRIFAIVKLQNVILPEPYSDESWEIAIKGVNTLGNIFKEKIEPYLNGGKLPSSIINFCCAVFEDEGIGRFVQWPVQEKGAFLTQLYQQENYLTYQVLKLFDGIPKIAFKQCQQCSKWFLHSSPREKIYCSKKCAYKHHASLRVTDEGKKRKYRKYMKDYMKKYRKL